MKRKLIGFCLSIIFAFGILTNIAAAASEEEIYAGNQLSVLGLLKGYSDGSLKLDNNITRAEVATLTVRMLGYENTVIVGNEKEFKDVAKSFWGYNNIQNAYKLSIMQGYPTNEFKPNNNITYAEVVAIMVNALGEGKELTGTWPDNYLDKGKALGVIPSNSTVSANKVVTRGEMSVIIWDTLLIKQ